MPSDGKLMSEFWGIVNGIAGEVGQWLQNQEEKQVRLFFKQQDLARLLKLAVWREMYCIEIPEMLDFIMPILRAQVPRQRKPGTLGITVAAMTGDGAARILTQELKKRYPDNEHISAFKDRQRELQLQAEEARDSDGLVTREKLLTLGNDVAEYARRYSEQVLKKRNAVQAELGNPQRKRKAYRGNCWR